MRALHILLSGAVGETRDKLLEEFATRLSCRSCDIELVSIPAEPGSNLVAAFETTVAKIGDRLNDVGSCSVVGIVDWVDAKEMSILTGSSYTTLSSMLVLAFPDVQWILNGCDDFGLGSRAQVIKWPLTDGAGTREFVKRKTRLSFRDITETVDAFPKREDLFLCLDEEHDYAFFAAYTAYRFGFRAVAPLTWTETLAVGNRERFPAIKASFEDLFLNFPDGQGNVTTHKAGKVRLSHLEERDSLLPILKGVSARLFVSAAGDVTQAQQIDERSAANAEYLGELKRNGTHVRGVSKPLEGIFRLWSEARIPEWLQCEWKSYLRESSEPKKQRDRFQKWQAPGFVWPPLEGASDPGDHSAPGRLLLVARTLLVRAERMLKDGVSSVADAVLGAVLATEALEMLGDRTPTTALEALAMKHQFEVLAECQFLGVRHNIEVNRRLDELRHEISFIAKRFPKTERKASVLDAEIAIVGKLIKIFQDYNQFDEEMKCLRWQRKAIAVLFQQRMVFKMAHPGAHILNLLHGLAGWCIGVLWRYLIWLVRSPGWFISWLFVWLGIGALAFSLAQVPNPLLWDLWPPEAFGKAADAFFAGNAPDGAIGLQRWIARFLTACGLFHFGVFISYIYTLISRK